jgi:macrolide transport system ATP-binding/permease protein
MRKLRGWVLRLAGLFDKQRKDRELDDEIESHLQLHIEDNLRLGMSPEEARRQGFRTKRSKPTFCIYCGSENWP